jgi:tetratricopeptide (TPR) repeat protein
LEFLLSDDLSDHLFRHKSWFHVKIGVTGIMPCGPFLTSLPFALITALVNKGNCLYAQGEYEKARDFYQEAYNVEATCTEALYNLGKCP